jgi:hypothetical protein
MGYAMEASGEALNPVDTQNSYMLSAGQNLPNHSTSMAGRGKFVRQSMNVIPEFRTKQQAYRFAAYLVTMADSWLPDEEGSELHDFETVLAAIRNT